jgi:7-cyano-7-deazaguanine synthase
MCKKIVLISGGLDSTVLLHQVVRAQGADNVIGLSIYYGQRHAIEKYCAIHHCNKLGVQYIEADLSDVFKYNVNASSLLKDSEQPIVHKSYEEQLQDTLGDAITAYVPYRNGLFLSFAASVAFQLDCDEIYYGAHSDDAAGSAYPDCTEEFIQAQAEAIWHGSGEKVGLTAPWWGKNKAFIVKRGLDMGLTKEDFENTWSCYTGNKEDGPCELCATCIDRRRAFQANGIDDIA